MGDADEVAKSVKRTQEQLGRFVKKPPLTEKNLSRPPFRFLHDIVKNVIDSTGFMNGVFTPEELDAANVSSRDGKTAFMQKLIGAIKDRTGEEVPIKISKVLAGVEAEKTNGLLQALARSIEVHQKEGGGGGGSAPAAKKAVKKQATTTKAPAPATSKGATPITKKAPGSNKPSDKKEPTTGAGGGTKRTIRDASPSSKPAGAKKPSSTEPTPQKSKTGGGAGGKAVKATPLPEAPTVPESIVNDETGSNAEEPEIMKKSAPTYAKEPPGPVAVERKNKIATEAGSTVTSDEVDNVLKNRGGGTTTTSTVAGHDDNYLNNANNNVDDEKMGSGGQDNDDDDHELYDNFTASVVKPNMQTLPPPTSPIMTDADAVNATMELPPMTPTINKSPNSLTTPTPPTPSPTSPKIGRSGSGRPPTGSGPRSLSREASAEQKGSPYASIGEVRPPTGQGQQIRSRPDTGTAGGRMSSARPPSAARRGPPRPKSSVVREEAEPYRPTTGKVAHVILDDTEDPDDDNYVVREVTVTAASKPPGLSDLDETPELGLGGGGPGGMMMMMGGGLGGEQLDDILPPDQRGLLVHQILETQKELEDKKGTEGTPVIEQKLKELSLAEIEKLKNFIQLCARSANPLAKLLDYMAEDVDSMQKEYNSFREESKRLSMELENAKGDTEKHLQSLKQELTEIERRIKDKQDAILASQMKIIQQEERMEEIVSGFERVRSGKSAAGAKAHMPDAEEILAHIQGQSSNFGGGSLFGTGGGPPSAFTFSGGGGGGAGGRLGSSTPSSAASTSIIGGSTSGPQESFKIPDSFMVGPAGGSPGPGGVSSPFSRGRMWSSMANNNNSATFDLGQNSINNFEDNDNSQPVSSSMMPKRNMGRSGTGLGGGMMDADNFNPWS